MAAMPSAISSSKGRATICTPMGSPSGDRPTGTTAAGAASVLNHCVCRTGVKVLDSAAVDGPGSLAVAKRRNAGHRAQQDRKRAHFLEHFRAQQVELRPCVEQFVGGERRRRIGDRQKLLEDGAQLVSLAGDFGA